MTDISQEIQGILELKARASAIQANAKSLFAQVNERVKGLRERIKRGETTGDRIRDFVIAHYDFPNKEIEAMYRDLEAQIGQHVGEFILMVAKDENFHGCDEFGYKPKDSDYVLDEYLYLGVLKDDALILNLSDNKCELSTGNHVLCRDVLWGDMELVEKNIAFHFSLNLNKQLKRRNPIACFQKEADLELEVKIGDAEVKEWFEKRREPHLAVFEEASHLLGRCIEESPPFTAEFQRQREAVAGCLVELFKERDQLKQEIARIFMPVKDGVYSPDGVCVTICETEDDARIISMIPRQKLNEVENEIKEQLAVALELGMADLQLISIRQLCREYNIAP